MGRSWYRELVFGFLICLKSLLLKGKIQRFFDIISKNTNNYSKGFPGCARQHFSLFEVRSIFFLFDFARWRERCSGYSRLLFQNFFRIQRIFKFVVSVIFLTHLQSEKSIKWQLLPKMLTSPTNPNNFLPRK